MKITKELVGLVIGVVAIVTNPWSGAYINQAIDSGFDKLQISGVGSVITVVAFGYFLGLTAWNMYKNRTITKIPAKTAPTKAQKYLEA